MVSTKTAVTKAEIKINRGFDSIAVDKMCAERGWVICEPFNLAILAGAQHRKDSNRVYQYNSYRKVVDHCIFLAGAQTGKPAAMLTAPYWTVECDGDPHLAAAKCAETCGLCVVAIPKAIYMVGQCPTQTFIFTRKAA